MTHTSMRLATTKEDFDRITEVVVEAFIHNPVYNYFASLKELIPKDRDTKEKKNLKKWARFMLNLCIALDGRMVVLEEHNDSLDEKSESQRRIVAFAQWLPPNKQLALWQVRVMYKAGIIGMIRRWGFAGLLRCGFEWLDKADQAMKDGCKKRNLGNPNATWHLHQIAVLPECQGKGYMSKLMREGFDHAPNEIFTLHATSADARDKYAHVGYEVVGTILIGRGKSSAQGLAAKGGSAAGVEAYSMVRVPN